MFKVVEIKHADNDLRILCLNIRSLDSNINDLLTFITQFKTPFDIISLNETFLNAGIEGLGKYNIPTYSHLTLNRGNNCRRGGIRIYYRDHLTLSKIEELTGEFETHEAIFATISLNNKSIVFGSIYRAPNKSIVNFNNYLSNILFNNESILNNRCIITGDTNIDYLLCDSRETHRAFNQIMIENGFEMQVSDKTRCSDQSGRPVSILDHVFTNFTANNVTTVIDTKITKSDHLAVIFSCKFSVANTKIKKTFSGFSTINFEKFKVHAPALYNNYEIKSNNIDDEINAFLNFNNNVIKRFFPTKVKYISTKRLKMPWITKRILKLINKKHKLFICYKRDQIPFEVYKAYAHILAIVLKRIRESYYKNRLNQPNDCRKTWSVINEILGRDRKYSAIKEILLNGEFVTDTEVISQQFCEYFSSIPIQTQNKLNEPINNYSELIPLNEQSLSFRQTTPTEIEKVINGLHKKGRGIPTKLLKAIKQYISPILCKLFNMCINEAYYPKCFKIARITPIHKSGNIKILSNYRPISTLINLNKILEKLLYNRINDFFETCSILSDNQFGFRKARDTQLAALKLLNYILPSLSSGKEYAGCVFLDFSKAFDTVSHDKLLQKLERYGVREKALKLVKSYLTDRTQFVTVNGKDSYEIAIEVGVPQGSCLGPLFYIIYANDLNRLINNLNAVTFADDTTVVEICNSVELLSLKLNHILSQILDWSNYNKLALNGSKTKWMLFSNRNVLAPDIFLAGDKVEKVASFKYLGMFLDNNLKHKTHIDYLRKKLARLRYISYKIRPYLTKESAHKFYYAMIQSHLCYGVLVWGGACACVEAFNKLCHLQDKIVFNLFSDTNDTINNVNTIYKENKILKLTDLYKVRVSIIMYKIINENYAPFLQNDLFTHVNTNPYNTRQNNMFVQPFPRVNCVKINFMSNAIKIWNDINLEIKQSTSVAIIKKKLTQEIINSY